MNKRGQVTVFVIVGVVILILAILIWYLRSSESTVIPGFFIGEDARRQAVETNLRECVEKAVRPTVLLAAKQGGDLTPVNYRNYKGDKVSYLCLNIPGKDQCLNVMPPVRIIEEKLKSNIANQIDNCVDRDLLGEDVIGTKNINVDVLMRRDAVVVNTDYDVAFVKDNVEMPFGTVTAIVGNVPFVELYDVVHDVVNAQAVDGDFEQLFYMLGKKGRVEIQVDRPYPDKIFIVNKKDSDFKFQFAIQGEEETSNL
jgi:hypothetical protein